jgi:hypothetical protein
MLITSINLGRTQNVVRLELRGKQNKNILAKTHKPLSDTSPMCSDQ